MKHAELLEDPQSLERGEQLVNLFIEGLQELRKDGPTEEDFLQNHGWKISELIETSSERGVMDDAAYAQLGRSVVEIRRKQLEMESWSRRDEVETAQWYAAFQPAHDFMTEYADKPLVAEQTHKNGIDIQTYLPRIRSHPRRVGGFIIPRVIGNAQLQIARRPGSDKPTARLQVFDRIEADTYGTHLKIAIAE